jgi:hypothetical protein
VVPSGVDLANAGKCHPQMGWQLHPVQLGLKRDQKINHRCLPSKGHSQRQPGHNDGGSPIKNHPASQISAPHNRP